MRLIIIFGLLTVGLFKVKKFLYKYEDDDALLAFRLSTRRNRRIPFQQVQRIVKRVYIKRASLLL